MTYLWYSYDDLKTLEGTNKAIVLLDDVIACEKRLKGSLFTYKIISYAQMIAGGIMGAIAPAMILTNHTNPKDMAIIAATGIVGLVTSYCGLKDIKWSNRARKKLEKEHKETLEERAELVDRKSKYRIILN